jgi:excisionase family DNA binding protein
MGNTHCDASRRAGSAGVSAALPEFYMAKGRNLRPKAGSDGTGSLARSAEGGAGALHRDENTEVMRMGEPLLLRAEEVAKLLSVGRSMVFEMISAGELPVVRIRRCVRVPRAALESWIESRAEGGRAA